MFVDDVIINDAIGFSALHHPEDTNYDIGDLIKFNSTITNLGNHYAPLNATFICPLKGLYLFAASILSSNLVYDSGIAIKIDNEVLVNVYLDAHESNVVYTAASALIMVECDVGQSVYAEATQITHVDGSRGASHFSGALIQRM